jgi:hypothetical protein
MLRRHHRTANSSQAAMPVCVVGHKIKALQFYRQLGDVGAPGRFTPRDIGSETDDPN